VRGGDPLQNTSIPGDRHRRPEPTHPDRVINRQISPAQNNDGGSVGFGGYFGV